MDTGPTVRSVTVRMNADVAKYIADMRMAGSETRKAFETGPQTGFNRELETTSQRLTGVNRSLDATSQKTRQVDQDTQHLSRSMNSAGNDLNKYTGRLSALAKGIAIIGPSITPITATAIPAIAGLTGGLGAAAGAAAVAMLAFHGVGDAVKAIDAYRLDPTTANLTKMQQAMAKMGPDGRSFVQVIDSLEPKLQGLQNLARAGLFPGAEDGIGHLLGLLPQVRSFISSISSELGDLASDAGRSLSGDGDWQKFFAYLQHDGAPIMDAFARSTGNVIAAVASLMRDFGSTETDFANGLEHSTEKLRAWADGLDQTQGFKDFLAYIHDETPDVVALLKALMQGVVALAKATAPWGSVMVPILTDVLKLFTAIAGSPLGPVLVEAAAGMAAFKAASSFLSGQSALGLGLRSLKTDAVALKAALTGLAPAAAAATTAGATAGAGGLTGGVTAASTMASTTQSTAVKALSTAETEYAAALTRSAEAADAVRAAEGQLMVARASGDAAAVAETEATLALSNAQLTEARSAATAASAAKWQAEAAVAAAPKAGLLSRVGAVASNGLVMNAAGIGGTLLLANGIGQKSTGKAAALNVTGGALLGASIGTSIAPGIGTAVGAGVGALSGALVTLATHLHAASDSVKSVTVDWSNLTSTLDGKGRPTASTRSSIGQSLINNGLLNAANAAGVSDTATISAASGNKAQLSALNAASQAKQSQLQSQLDMVQKAGTYGAQVDPKAVDELRQQIQAQKDLQANVAKAASEIDSEAAAQARLKAAAAGATGSIKDQIAAQQALHQQSLSDFDAVTSFGQAIQTLAKQAASGAKGFNQFTAAGAANRSSVSGAIQAYNSQSKAVKNSVSGYEQMRSAVIRFATQMGATKSQLAAFTAAIDKPRKLVVGAQTQSALDAIARVKAEMASLHDKSVRLTYYVTQVGGANKRAALAQKATGGYLTGPGTGTSDDIPIWASNGEYIVNAKATARNRALLEHINAQRYADGGLVGGAFDYNQSSTQYSTPNTSSSSSSSSSSSKSKTKKTKKPTKAEIAAAKAAAKAAANLEKLSLSTKNLNGKEFKDLRSTLRDLVGKDLKLTGDSLKDLNKASKVLNKSLTSVSSQLDTAKSNRDAVSSSVTSSLSRDLWTVPDASTTSSPNVWTAKSLNPTTPTWTPQYAISQLHAEGKDATEFNNLIGVVKKKGITGPALAELLSNGGIDALRAFAKASTSVDRQYAAAYNADFNAKTGAVTLAAKNAGQATYGAQIADLQKEVKTLNGNVKDVTKAIKDKTTIDHSSRQKAAEHGAKKTGEAVKENMDKAAKNAKRR